MGHTTYRTPSSGDGGIDVVAIKGSDGLLIQCKTTSVAGKELGWDGVKDVIAGAAAYHARHPDVRLGLGVWSRSVMVHH
ncbi:MAG: SNF2-related [Rhodospirillaceae bacterium]|nr:MAG: SNF2-related [Rhodospirillaceae bacterium]TNC93500.1 MAG: SNF2-related protein [Stygiobacter sp.]